MREIQASMITDTIERLCIEANQVLPDDIKKSIQTCRSCEDGQIACGILDNIIENYEIAENEQVPICQDTGMACVFTCNALYRNRSGRKHQNHRWSERLRK